jgi:O-antigen/teichoic acid export membrane protein
LSESKRIIRDGTAFTVSGYISSVFNFISAIIVRRILSPFFMGIYAELALIFEYAKYNHFGMIDSLDRQIPYYNGKKEFGKAEEIKNIGVSFSLFASLFSALIIIAFSYVFKGRLSPSLFVGLKVIAVMVIAQSMSSFYVTLVRTHHLFGSLSRYVIIVAVCDVLFKAVLGIKFGVIGILWATVVTLILGILYLFKRTGFRFKITLNIPGKAVKSLLGIGFPILLAGFTFMVLRSIDRIMIIAFLSKEDLGYYSIAIMMHSFVFQLPNLMYTVLFPRFYEAFGGSENNIDKLRGYLEKPTLAFAYLFPVIIGVAVIILPLLVNYILPRYADGINPASILLFGTFFISITNMSSYLLIALKRQNMLLLIGGGCVIISAFLNLIFIKVFHMGIEGVALGTALAYFFYSFFIIGCAMRQYIKSLYNKIKFFLDLYLPLLWVLLIFYIFGFIFSYDFKNLKLDIGTASLETVIFLMLTSPLLISVNKKIGLYSKVKDAGFKFFKR